MGYADELASDDGPFKYMAWRSWLAAWRMNKRGDMDLDPIHLRTARSRFERWWKREYE